jgi:hypothetical protein
VGRHRSTRRRDEEPGGLERLGPGVLEDRGAGGFRIGPADVAVPAARRYLPGSLMVETTWKTRTGWLIVRDALCVGRGSCQPTTSASAPPCWRSPTS